MSIGSPYAYLIPLANAHVAEHVNKPGAHVEEALKDFKRSVPTSLPFKEQEYLYDQYHRAWVKSSEQPSKEN